MATTNLSNVTPQPLSYSICMCSDFFYPNVGGVENHIYDVALRLIERGHRVCVVTHAYGGRKGVRYMAGGLKVYYLPNEIMLIGVIFPLVYDLLALMRDVFVRESVDVVHCHGPLSTIAHVAVNACRVLGMPTVWTDHSLFGFGDLTSVFTNKICALSLAECSHVIAVSHCAKENTCVRTNTAPSKVSVIPNAVDSDLFTPQPELAEAATSAGEKKKKHECASPAHLNNDHVGRGARPITSPIFSSAEDGCGRAGADSSVTTPTTTTATATTTLPWLTVVIVSRLVYRKGTDLMEATIPLVCSRLPWVRFVVAGDGPNRIALEEMRERHRLHARVDMLGAVPHRGVPGVLARGKVFLNCSLTDAFCMAVVEAASMGLFVASTAVGGIPEVMPNDMMALCPPEADALADKVVELCLEARALGPEGFASRAYTNHARLRAMYNWTTVAAKTERVYTRVLASPVPDLAAQIRSTLRLGPFSGPFFAGIALAGANLGLRLIEWLSPRANVELAPDYTAAYREWMARLQRKRGSSSSCSSSSISGSCSGGDGQVENGGDDCGGNRPDRVAVVNARRSLRKRARRTLS